MTTEKTAAFRCHDAEACALGQKACPTPTVCGCEAPACAVKDGTYKPAEALQEIAEPKNWDSPLSDFQEGQWWVNELDAMASHPVGQTIHVTADMIRAVSVVHHMLRAAHNQDATIAEPAQQPEALQVAQLLDDNRSAFGDGRDNPKGRASALLRAQHARIAELEAAESQLIAQRDHCEEVIDRMADSVLGKDRHEWTSAYGFMDAAAEVDDRMAALEAAPQVLIDFAKLGTAGPFAVVDGRVQIPAETMADLERMLKPTIDALDAAQAAHAAVPVAWMDGGETRNGSHGNQFRVITDKTKRDMPRAASAAYTTPLYAHPAEGVPAQMRDALEEARDALEEVVKGIQLPRAAMAFRKEVQALASVRAALAATPAAPAYPAPYAPVTLWHTGDVPTDPMDWPLPCDVTVGHGTMRKGVSLRTLVLRMKALYQMATGNDADEVAARTPEQRAQLLAAFQAQIGAIEEPPAAAPVVLPEPDRDDAYTRRVIEALEENGDPVSVEAAEEMERLRALLAQASAEDAQAAAVAVTTLDELAKLSGENTGSKMATVFHPASSGFPVKLYAAPAADAIRELIALHGAELEKNAYAYFELAYHRRTGWMAWITDKPLCMPPVESPDRNVIAKGQGDTPEAACDAAIAARAAQAGKGVE